MWCPAPQTVKITSSSDSPRRPQTLINCIYNCIPFVYYIWLNSIMSLTCNIASNQQNRSQIRVTQTRTPIKWGTVYRYWTKPQQIMIFKPKWPLITSELDSPTPKTPTSCIIHDSSPFLLRLACLPIWPPVRLLTKTVITLEKNFKRMMMIQSTTDTAWKTYWRYTYSLSLCWFCIPAWLWHFDHMCIFFDPRDVWLLKLFSYLPLPFLMFLSSVNWVAP